MATTYPDTILAHGYTTGDSVTVANASPNAYNGTRTITVVDANTFTYTAATAPGKPHILLLTGTREAMSLPLIPFMLGSMTGLMERIADRIVNQG